MTDTPRYAPDPVEHDPLCIQSGPTAKEFPELCDCDLILTVMERERVGHEANVELLIKVARENVRGQIAESIRRLHYTNSMTPEHACADQYEHELLERIEAMVRQEVRR
jgi:hypothetical protein